MRMSKPHIICSSFKLFIDRIMQVFHFEGAWKKFYKSKLSETEKSF